MRFNLCDHVRIKSGTVLEETGDVVDDWAGEIIEAPDDDETDDHSYLVELDAPTLENLPKAYLQDCIEKHDLPLFYNFTEEVLELSEQRDTPEQREAAQKKISDLIEVDDEDYEKHEAAMNQLILGFQQSPQFRKLGDFDPEEAASHINTFGEFAFQYCDESISDWDKNTVKEVVTYLLPAKMTAEHDVFENMARVFLAFFEFLRADNLHPQAEKMHREMKTAAQVMLRNANDPSQWGMAKSIAMQALGEGVDLSSEAQLARFFKKYNEKLLGNLPAPIPLQQPSFFQPARENPFKNIGRNELVQVRYADGTVKEGKFKRLEAELLAGNCELIN